MRVPTGPDAILKIPIATPIMGSTEESSSDEFLSPISSSESFWLSPISRESKKRKGLDGLPLLIPPLSSSSSLDINEPLFTVPESSENVLYEFEFSEIFKKPIEQSTKSVNVPLTNTCIGSSSGVVKTPDSKPKVVKKAIKSLKFPKSINIGNPKVRGVKMEKAKPGVGSSCHQCKSRRMNFDLAYCSKERTATVKGCKRPCKKKFCYACLDKFYQEKDNDIGPDWECPACRGQCCCAACRRSSIKQDLLTNTHNESVMKSKLKKKTTKKPSRSQSKTPKKKQTEFGSPELVDPNQFSSFNLSAMSPATSVASRIVYFNGVTNSTNSNTNSTNHIINKDKE